MCNLQHAKIGFLPNPKCPLCPQEDESVSHVIRDCYKASAIWKALIGVDEFNRQCQYPIKEWILISIRDSQKKILRVEGGASCLLSQCGGDGSGDVHMYFARNSLKRW